MTPKRKNTLDSDTIEFVIELSVDECIERLERGPSHTLDHRLNVRIDGSRFVVDALAEVPRKGPRHSDRNANTHNGSSLAFT